MKVEFFLHGSLNSYIYISQTNDQEHQEHQPAFAQALSDFFKESYLRTLRPSVVQALMTGTTAKYEADQKLMKDVADNSEIESYILNSHIPQG